MSEATQDPAATAGNDKKVTIYGAEWCGYCHQAMQYFDKKNVAYTYHDVEREPDAARELMEKLGGPIQGVPVIDVYGDVILGYDLTRINTALQRA